MVLQKWLADDEDYASHWCSPKPWYLNSLIGSKKILEPVAWFCCFRHIYSKMQLIVTSVFSMFIYVSLFYPETLVQMIRCPFCLSHNQLVGVLKCLQNHPPSTIHCTTSHQNSQVLRRFPGALQGITPRLKEAGPWPQSVDIKARSSPDPAIK